MIKHFIRVKIERLSREEDAYSSSDRETIHTHAIGEIEIKGDPVEVEDAVNRMASNGLRIVLNRP